MSSELDAIVQSAAENLLKSLATRAKVDVDAAQLAALAVKWVSAGISLIDGHAKKHAEAAGDAAADSIKTEDAAEAALRKP